VRKIAGSSRSHSGVARRRAHADPGFPASRSNRPRYAARIIATRAAAAGNFPTSVVVAEGAHPPKGGCGIGPGRVASPGAGEARGWESRSRLARPDNQAKRPARSANRWVLVHLQRA